MQSTLLIRTLSLFTLVMLTSAISAHAETTRADLLKLPGAVPFTEARVREWQPLVAEFGGVAFSEWERGLYEGAVGNHEPAKKWLLRAAEKGSAPESQSLCLAYKLARGTQRENNDDLLGEKKKSDAAVEQVQSWYESAAAKLAKKKKLSLEEKAAFSAIDALPDGDEGNQLARRRIVICRNLTTTPSPDKLFRAAAAKGRSLPPYALNYLGIGDEQAERFDQAADWYFRAADAGFIPARTNLIRLHERVTSPAVGDSHWESLLVDYARAANEGDASAMILLADAMERGLSGVASVAAAIELYKKALDFGTSKPEINEGMGYVFLAMYAQERLTEHYQAGRFKLANDDKRKKYLSMGFLLNEAFGKKAGGVDEKP